MRKVATLLLAAAGLLAGCATKPGPLDSARLGPFFQPKNFTGDAHLPRTLQRVLLLPAHAEEPVASEALEELDPVFAQALGRQMRFEVVSLSREECQRSYGSPDLSSAGALPRDFLAELGRKYAVDAIVFVDLTTFHPYRPLALGLRMKLASVSDRHLIWAFDEIFSTENPAVANGARRFYIGAEAGGTPYDMTIGALQSPARFAAYAADAAFRTLPPR